METRHTPGPWTFHPSTPDTQDAIVAPVAFVLEGDIYRHADAELIAAAPDLLEALNKALPHIRKLKCNHKHSPDCDACLAEEIVSAAIKQATGVEA